LKVVPLFAYNIKPELIEEAISEKTRAIMLAHTMGNPFNVDEVLRVAQKYDLWVIEDCCDALGSTYTLNQSTIQQLNLSTPQQLNPTSDRPHHARYLLDRSLSGID